MIPDAPQNEADAPTTPSRTAKKADHRRAPRRRAEQEIVIELIVGGKVQPPVAVAMRDFSPRGVGFLYTKQLESGSQFILTLIQNGGAPTHLLYNVTRCRKAGGGIWNVGAEFLCVVTDRNLTRQSA